MKLTLAVPYVHTICYQFKLQETHIFRAIFPITVNVSLGALRVYFPILEHSLYRCSTLLVRIRVQLKLISFSDILPTYQPIPICYTISHCCAAFKTHGMVY